LVTRECRGCRSSFTPSRKNQVYCSPECRLLHRGTREKNTTRQENRDVHAVRFIGVDGEGVTRPDGTHNYIMLSVGERTIFSKNDDTPLTWREIFPFLYQCFLLDPDAAYAGFSLGYDYAQWFRTMPEERMRLLLTPAGIAIRQPKSAHIPHPFPVRFHGWEFDIMGGRFKLRPEGRENKWMWICDAFPFFQCSFIKAIGTPNDPHPIVTDDEYAIILEGKANRAVDSRYIGMDTYNVTENCVMGRLMERLNTGFVHMGIRLKRTQWFGPGQSAGAWLKASPAPTKDDVALATPPDVLASARASYYGGWFEIFAHGHIPGKVWEYDINSAYPNVIRTLPCLLHGMWRRNDPSGRSPTLSLVYATMYGNDDSDFRIGVHSHRSRTGLIYRPKISQGWIWRHELDANLRLGSVQDVDIHTTWNYYGCDCPPPLADMENLYSTRLEVGKNTPQGVACKLVYNSTYGKMAQSVGNPLHANPIYASLITAGCRTQIIDAIATHPAGVDSVVMVATDGVYFRDPHPGLPIDPNKLGAWDAAEKHNLTLLMPGVYWDDKTREKGASAAKSRGVPRAALADIINYMDDAFQNFGMDSDWPTMEIPLGFTMLTPRQALARNNWQLAGTVSHTQSKSLSANPHTKRDADSRYLHRGAVYTNPYTVPGQSITSLPYDKSFGLDLSAEPVGLDGLPWNHGIAEDMK
jgi:hypothetical protein